MSRTLTFLVVLLGMAVGAASVKVYLGHRDADRAGRATPPSASDATTTDTPRDTSTSLDEKTRATATSERSTVAERPPSRDRSMRATVPTAVMNPGRRDADGTGAATSPSPPNGAPATDTRHDTTAPASAKTRPPTTPERSEAAERAPTRDRSARIATVPRTPPAGAPRTPSSAVPPAAAPKATTNDAMRDVTGSEDRAGLSPEVRRELIRSYFEALHHLRD